MELKVVLEPSDEGGFAVYVPSLPGCISEGKTKGEALKNIREAIEQYLEPVDGDLVLHSGATIENADGSDDSKVLELISNIEKGIGTTAKKVAKQILSDNAIKSLKKIIR